MLSSVTFIISIVTVFQLILFSFFLFTQKKGRRQSFILLSLFLLVNALYILNFLLPRIGTFLKTDFINFYFIGGSCGFLFGPLLFLYTRSITFADFKVKLKDLLHALPFLVYNFLMFFNYYLLGHEAKRRLLESGSLFPGWLSFFINLFMNVQILIYIAASLFILFDYRKAVKKYYSSIESLNLSWLEWVLYAFVIMWLIDLTNFVVFRTIGGSKLFFQLMNFISLSINFVFANVILFKSLRHPEIFVESEEKNKIKYEKSTLTKDESEKFLGILTDYMKTEKPYFTSSLTVGELAKKIDIPVKYLSQIINENFNQNFFDFINSYRIEEAKNILLNSQENKKTVLEILYEVGFNSKSVFNTAFKKNTGLTPTQFKKLNTTAVVSQ